MHNRAVRVLVLALLIAGSAAACSNEPPDEKDYVPRINAARSAKDAAFLKEPAPVPENRKAELLPLLYYPVDESYNVPAELKPSSESPTLTMPTSNGEMRPMRRVGALEFTLKGQRLRLTAFVEAGAPDVNHLFVPFRDLTTGTETYEAGRYLDLDRTVTGLYELDFNLAYNPNCYFSPMYSCPIPPKENHLSIAVQAGERVKKSEGDSEAAPAPSEAQPAPGAPAPSVPAPR
jgi:uncharacterized protein (DUF1684 family)